MRNVELIIKKIEQLEGKHKQMKVGATRVSLDEFYQMVDSSSELLQDIKFLVSRDTI